MPLYLSKMLFNYKRYSLLFFNRSSLCSVASLAYTPIIGTYLLILILLYTIINFTTLLIVLTIQTQRIYTVISLYYPASYIVLAQVIYSCFYFRFVYIPSLGYQLILFCLANKVEGGLIGYLRAVKRLDCCRHRRLIRISKPIGLLAAKHTSNALINILGYNRVTITVYYL